MKGDLLTLARDLRREAARWHVGHRRDLLLHAALQVALAVAESDDATQCVYLDAGRDMLASVMLERGLTEMATSR